MLANSARVGTQSRILPRRLIVISKFTCDVVPTAGTTSTSTATPRSVIVKVRGRVPMNVARRLPFAAAVFLRLAFEPSSGRLVFTPGLMNHLDCDCQRRLLRPTVRLSRAHPG